VDLSFSGFDAVTVGVVQQMVFGPPAL